VLKSRTVLQYFDIVYKLILVRSVLESFWPNSA